MRNFIILGWPEDESRASEIKYKIGGRGFRHLDYLPCLPTLPTYLTYHTVSWPDRSLTSSLHPNLPYLILPCPAFSLRWAIIPLFHIDDIELLIGRSSCRREKDSYWTRQDEALGLFMQKLCFEYTMTDCALRNPAVVVASGEQWSVCDCLHDVWRLGILDGSDGEEIFMDNENSDSMDCSTPRRHLLLHVAAEPFRRSLCCYGMKEVALRHLKFPTPRIDQCTGICRSTNRRCSWCLGSCL